MKILKVILIAVIMCFASTGIAEDKKYQPTPKPHYSEEKGYGWNTNVPLPRPGDKWQILKVWNVDKKYYSLFMDMAPFDGVCDVVIEIVKTGEVDENGTPFADQLPDSDCKVREAEIKQFLDDKKLGKETK